MSKDEIKKVAIRPGREQRRQVSGIRVLNETAFYKLTKFGYCG